MKTIATGTLIQTLRNYSAWRRRMGGGYCGEYKRLVPEKWLSSSCQQRSPLIETREDTVSSRGGQGNRPPLSDHPNICASMKSCRRRASYKLHSLQYIEVEKPGCQLKARVAGSGARRSRFAGHRCRCPRPKSTRAPRVIHRGRQPGKKHSCSPRGRKVKVLPIWLAKNWLREAGNSWAEWRRRPAAMWEHPRELVMGTVPTCHPSKGGEKRLDIVTRDISASAPAPMNCEGGRRPFRGKGAPPRLSPRSLTKGETFSDLQPQAQRWWRGAAFNEMPGEG